MRDTPKSNRKFVSMINVIAQYMPGWVQKFLGTDDWYDDERPPRTISSEKALSYAPIWYGVNKIAGHVAQLPVCVYKRLERGAERDREHYVHKVMRRPNVNQSSIVFREQVASHSLLDGDGRAAIVRSGTRVVELLPLHPEWSTTLLIDGIKVHGARPPANDRLRLFFPAIDQTEEGLIMLDDSDVLHVPGLSLNGITGIALRRIAQRNLGASIDSETRLAKQMQQGFSGSLMLNAPVGALRNQKDAEEFLEAFEKRHNSPDKAGKVGLLREGITANILAMSNKDAEMIENRKFQRQDAALYLGLESILGDDASVSYNSLEQKNLAYLMNCLNRWLKRWEEEMEYKLLRRREFDNETHFIRFNTAALLKSDFQSTVAALNSLVTSTIFSRNEAREKLDMNPVPGGDEYANPAITPGVSEPADTEPMDDTPEETAVRRAINSRITHLIGVESKNVVQAAKNAVEKGKNYVDWVEKYYSENWSRKLADTFEELGLEREDAADYCHESKRQILDVCGDSTAENLVENVEKCVFSWKNRVNSIGLKHV